MGEERTRSSLPKLRIVLGRTLGLTRDGGGGETDLEGWKQGYAHNRNGGTNNSVSPPVGCETNSLPAVLESSSPPDVEQKENTRLRTCVLSFFSQVAALE